MKQVLQGSTRLSSEKNMVILALKVADPPEGMCNLFHCHVDLPHGTFLPFEHKFAVISKHCHVDLPSNWVHLPIIPIRNWIHPYIVFHFISLPIYLL